MWSRKLALALAVALFAPLVHAETPGWEGHWTFNDCPHSVGACSRVNVTVTKKDRGLRAVVEATPAQGLPRVWQEDAHVRQGALDIASGVPMAGVDTLVTLTRKAAQVCLHFKHLQSENGHTEICEVVR